MLKTVVSLTQMAANDIDFVESMLIVRLLGTTEIRLGNHWFSKLGSRKVQALFIYLIVTAKPVARSLLTTLLWPEMGEKAAKNNLRTTLAKLKENLGAYLDITTATVAFHYRLPYHLDVESLRIGLESAIAAHDIAALQATLDLYQGEFLQGFHVRNAEPFEEWLLQEREQLHLLVLHAMETLLTLCIEQGEHTIGLDAGRKLLAIEPWSEIAHRQIMRLLAASGQRAAALAQYETCCKILSAELGIDPMPETTDLYRQIQLGTLPDLHLPHETRQQIAPTTIEAITDKTLPTQAAIPNNLLTPLDKFIGREEELAFISERLTAADCRLLTVVGLGGIGKSAIALVLGQRLLHSSNTHFPDGIFFVSLAGIEIVGDYNVDTLNPAMPIIGAIAEAIGYQFQGDQPAYTQLQAYLRRRRLLLILDNFEQLIAYSTTIVTLLTHAPDITVLVTSRIRLNVRGETIVLLHGLSLLSTDDTQPFHEAATWQKSEAVVLFVERAQSLDPDFTANVETISAILQICQAVGGLPLALEMITAWVPLYSCAEIAEKLQRGHPENELLTTQFVDHPSRHQDIQTVFEDSWHLLSEGGQWALAQLSIFGGQFTRQAARVVAEIKLSDLMQLRNHSLLQVDADSSYSLHPLIKQFAVQKWQQLTRGQPQQRHLLQRAHSHYYLQEIMDLARAGQGKEVLEVIQRLQKTHAEIVRSWQWIVQDQDRIQIQRSMVGLLRYLELTNQTSDGKALFGIAAEQQLGPIAAWLTVAQCHFLRRLADHDQARAQLEEVVEALDSEFTDKANATMQGTAVEGGISPIVIHTFALSVLGWVHYEQGEYEKAHSCFSTAYRQAEATGDYTHLVQTLNGLGSVAFSRKQYTTARKHYRTALNYTQQQGDLHYTAVILGNLAAMAQATNAYTKAEHYLEMRLQLDQQTQNVRQMAISYQRLGQLALSRKRYAKAESHFRGSLTYFEQLGNSPEITHVLLDLGKSLLRQDQLQLAETQCLRSLQMAIHAQMMPRILSALTLLAEIRIAEGKKDETATLLQMVSRHAEIPAATWKTAKQLQTDLLVELGEDTMYKIDQTIAGESLLEFGLQLLRGSKSNTQ